ncbi:MAG: hypothetical protein WDZ70_00860 [Candidatus Paceibacterota bacterium]
MPQVIGSELLIVRALGSYFFYKQGGEYYTDLQDFSEPEKVILISDVEYTFDGDEHSGKTRQIHSADLEKMMDIAIGHSAMLTIRKCLFRGVGRIHFPVRLADYFNPSHFWGFEKTSGGFIWVRPGFVREITDLGSS